MRVVVSDGGNSPRSVTATGTVVVLRNKNAPELAIGQAAIINVTLFETANTGTFVTNLNARDADRIVSVMQSQNLQPNPVLQMFYSVWSF